MCVCVCEDEREEMEMRERGHRCRETRYAMYGIYSSLICQVSGVVCCSVLQCVAVCCSVETRYAETCTM